MPSRLLREGILDSSAVNSLTFPAEVFYRRLMSVVDDYGRFDGRTAVLRGRLYSLKLDTVREADISRWIAECVNAGLIALYEADAKPYILFWKLGPARAKESKFPAPPPHLAVELRLRASVNGCTQTQTDASNGLQTRADVPYSYSGTGTDSSSDSGAKPVATIPLVAIPAELDTEEFRTAWGEWKADRAERNIKAYTPRGEAMKLKELAPYGPTVAIAAIRSSIGNQWQGLFPEKVKAGGGHASGTGGSVGRAGRASAPEGKYEHLDKTEGTQSPGSEPKTEGEGGSRGAA